MTTGPRSLLGLHEHFVESDRSRWADALTKTWVAAMGAHPGGLDEDLEACRRWFDPVAQGHRLRRDLENLPKMAPHLIDPGPPLTLAIDRSRRLVTPEGRCALDLLQSLDPDLPGHVISDATLLAYDRRLGRLYQTWSRHRLSSVVELLAGDKRPLQVPAAGVVVALLVNRCTSEDRALIRFIDAESREIVERAFFSPVHVFSDVIAPSSRRGRTNRWMLYEARRRLGGGLVVVDPRRDTNGKVWISPDLEEEVIDRVAKDLARGHRTRATRETLGVAFDALVESLRESLPVLAGFGLAFERPRHTARLRETILERLSRYYVDP